MSENLALRLKEVPMPQDYFDYYTKISEEVFTIFEQAASAKATLADSSGMVEPKIAFDLADRVSKMHDIDVTDNLRCPTRVYHLRRSVEDFERALEYLTATRLKGVPHIVLGLHCGQFLGEGRALEIIRRH